MYGMHEYFYQFEMFCLPWNSSLFFSYKEKYDILNFNLG